jgi:ubiquinone/menaquinone biosynthesis C-methylase UbiE
MLWGISLWTALLAALLLVCPALILWGLIETSSLPQAAQETIPETRGMTLNWLAPFYDSVCRFYGLGRSFREETLRHAALKPGERVLDVGCGTGVLTRVAAEMVGASGQALGIDPAPRMIAVARKNAAGNSQAEFRIAAIERLPFESGSFDVAVASLMLHHLPPDLKLGGLREVYRVLKPGGRLIVVDLDRPANSLWWLLAWPLLMMPMTASNLRGEIPSYLRDAKFDPVHAQGRRMQLLTFWQATKPMNPGGPS